MILRWAVAALIALSVVACGVKSNLDLPSGMPKEVFLQLHKVRVAGQPLQISRALKTHVEKLRRERPSAAKFKGKPQKGAPRGPRK